MRLADKPFFAARTLPSSQNQCCVAVVLIVVALLHIPVVEASVPCQTNEDCRGLLNHAVGASINPEAPPSLAVCGMDGVCTNPYQNGCLINRLPGWTKLRICNSEDPDNAAELGLCAAPQVGWDHMEIRIASQNWESTFFEAWILQILLSELLNVPTSIETGVADKNVNLYDPATRMDYGSSNVWTALERAKEVGDCRNGSRTEGDPYLPCAHVITEVWSGAEAEIRDFEEREVTEPHDFIGVVGFEAWFVPKFTGERDPTVLTYLGLGGEANRRKLAERFKRPTTWQDYCDLVSIDRCLTDDGVAKRAPFDESEYDHMFLEGLYTGHFRMTEENDCDKWPLNCTGHIADYPCGWTSNVLPLTYHLDIALESNGKEPGSKGYTYGQLIEIWLAANATKSDVMLQWWTPEALYSRFDRTDAEFLSVSLPPANNECMKHRVNYLTRCEDYTFEEKVGNPIGACGDAPLPLMKVVSSALYRKTYDPKIPEARISPGYELINNFRIDGFQLGEIFDYWLHAGFDKWNLYPRDATCRWVVENFEELQRFVPRSYPRVLQENEDSYTNPLAYTSFILGGVVTACVLVVAAMIFKHKSRRVMVYAQVEFMFLLLAGVLLVSIAAMIQAIRPTNIRCVTLIWLINLGYTLELVPLIVKIGAINRLMQAARRMKRVMLSRKKLFGAVALLVSIVCFFLILWTVLDAPQARAFYTFTESKPEFSETIVLLDHFCASDRFRRAWQFTSLGAQCFLLLVASVLAFQTRNLSKGVNEAQTLATLIYSHFVFVGCRFLILIFEASLGAAVATQIFSLLYSLDSFATLTIYFLPKLMAGENEESMKREYGRSSSFARAPNPLVHVDAIAESGSSLVGFIEGVEPFSNTQTLVDSTPGLADHDLLSPGKPNQAGCTDSSVP